MNTEKNINKSVNIRKEEQYIRDPKLPNYFHMKQKEKIFDITHEYNTDTAIKRIKNNEFSILNDSDQVVNINSLEDYQ